METWKQGICDIFSRKNSPGTCHLFEEEMWLFLKKCWKSGTRDQYLMYVEPMYLCRRKNIKCLTSKKLMWPHQHISSVFWHQRDFMVEIQDNEEGIYYCCYGCCSDANKATKDCTVRNRYLRLVYKKCRTLKYRTKTTLPILWVQIANVSEDRQKELCRSRE